MIKPTFTDYGRYDQFDVGFFGIYQLDRRQWHIYEGIELCSYHVVIVWCVFQHGKLV